MKLSERTKYTISGIIGVVGGLGLFAAKKASDDFSDLEAKEPTAQMQTQHSETPKTQEVGDATLHLDADNPEIVINNKSEAEKTFETSKQLESTFKKHLNVEDLYTLPQEEKAAAVKKMATDYRACQKSMEEYGEIREDIVGEDNICSQFYDADGVELLGVAQIRELATIVMTEEYAKVTGAPRNEQEQEILDKLGPEFSSLYQATLKLEQDSHKKTLGIMKNIDQQLASVADISTLNNLLERSLTDNITEAEKLILEQADSILRDSIENSMNNRDQDGSMAHQNLAADSLSDSMFFSPGNIENVHLREYLVINKMTQRSIEKDPSEKGHSNAYELMQSIHIVAERFGLRDKIDMDITDDTLEIKENHISMER